MKETLPPPSDDKIAEGNGAVLRASSGCLSNCSSNYKKTRTSLYDNMFILPMKCKPQKESKQVTARDYSTSLRVQKVLVMAGVFVMVVLMAVVGIALTIHSFGKVSSVPQKHDKEHRWTIFNSVQETHQPPPKHYLLNKTLSILRLFHRQSETTNPSKVQHCFDKIRAALGLVTKHDKKLTEEQKQKLIAISKVKAVISTGVFNLALTLFVYLLLP